MQLGTRWNVGDEPPARLRAEIARRQLDPATAWILKPGETVKW